MISGPAYIMLDTEVYIFWIYVLGGGFNLPL